jgi:hypothetical protein
LERINIPGHKIAGFFNQYLAAVNWVRKNKSAPREEKLNRLLFPLVKFRKIAALPPGKEIPHRFFNGTFPFTSANRIKSTDLDLDNLHYDQKRYFIDWEVDNITRRRGPGIWLCETKEEKELRARMRREEEKRRGFPLEDEFIHCQYPGDLYENWLPSLDQARIQSRDLLDQILVCHTIKRALNGQEKAIAKLYGLYVDAAEATAVRFAKISKLIGKPSASSEGKKKIEKGVSRGYLKDIKNDANEL